MSRVDTRAIAIALALSCALCAASAESAAVARRGAIRVQIANCDPADLFELSTNRAAQLLDPALCGAVQSIQSTDDATREAGEAWFIENDYEPGIILVMMGCPGWFDGLIWLSSNGSTRAVGEVLRCYDGAVVNETGPVLNDQYAGVLRRQKESCLAVLRHVYGEEFERSVGSASASLPPKVADLALVQFAREKWTTFHGDARRWTDSWPFARRKLLKMLEQVDRAAAGDVP